MSRRTAVIFIAAIVSIALLMAFFWWRRSGDGRAEAGDPSGSQQAQTAVSTPFELFFPGPSGLLVPERRQIDAPSDPAARARILVESLLGGSQSDDLVAPFPEGVTLSEVYLGDDGVAYVDFAAEGAERPPASGSAMEALRVYSVVNSVVVNVPEIRRVVLLWNGQQPDSLAGHIDTMLPLEPRSDLVER